MTDRPTRRRFIGSAGAIAAASALPSTVQAAIQQPTVLATRLYDAARARQTAAAAEVGRIEEELLASGLTPAQRRIWSRWMDANGDLLVCEQDLFVEALAAHMPGLAPAFRALSDGSHGDLPFLTCCEHWREG